MKLRTALALIASLLFIAELFGVWYLIKTAPPDPTDFGPPIHIHTP
jgi:hypothetical protein